MAKVVMPLLSGRVSGKVGDIVFYERYGQQLARRRTKPSNPKTPAQELVRHNLKTLSRAWKGQNGVLKYRYKENNQIQIREVAINGLTEEQRTAWINRARELGKYNAYGRLMFVSENLRRFSQVYENNQAPTIAYMP